MEQTKQQMAPHLVRIVMDNVKQWRKQHHKSANANQSFKNEPRILKLSKNPPLILDIDPATGEVKVDQ